MLPKRSKRDFDGIGKSYFVRGGNIVMTPYLQVFFTVARKQRGGFQLSGIGAKKHCMMPLHPIRNLLRYNTPISCFFPTYVIIIVTAILLGLMHKCSFSESRWAIWPLFIVWQIYGLGATYIYSLPQSIQKGTNMLL